MHFPGKKLILFDLDGVLLNSKRNMELSWGAVCERHDVNVEFEDFIYSDRWQRYNDLVGFWL
jgi:beta-phosphoglucomutase-like phosphatase (HAD superfamily)